MGFRTPCFSGPVSCVLMGAQSSNADSWPLDTFVKQMVPVHRVHHTVTHISHEWVWSCQNHASAPGPYTVQLAACNSLGVVWLAMAGGSAGG
jgi:hypothetical protein